jgi:hypothetical protein
MARHTAFARSIVALALVSLVWLNSLAPARAAPIADTFQLSGSEKEWCRGNPRFFEASTGKATDGVSLTITRDPLNTGDINTIHATVVTGSAELNAIALKGRLFPSNKSGSIAQLVLFGTLNNGHFLTIRGQATFDKEGQLIRVTMTAFDRITDSYTLDRQGDKSLPVECFESVTLRTHKKLSTIPIGLTIELAIGSPLPSHVERNTESFYYVLNVVPGTAYTVSITGVTDSASLSILGGVNVCTPTPLNVSPKDCKVTASGSALNIIVDGQQVIGSAADYVIMVVPAPVVTLPITGTGGSVPPGIPTVGLVGTRDTSRYVTTGLIPGTHTVSIIGLTGDADLHVFTDETYSSELDCTLRRPGDVTNLSEECTLATGAALYFSVASGELNRDGAGYLILVW